jgi:hypothetical protein
MSVESLDFESVWYDAASGDYCTIVSIDETIGLCHLDEEDPYFKFDDHGYTQNEAVDKITDDFTQVSAIAVEDPEILVNRAVRLIMRNDVNELMAIPTQESINLAYAWSQVSLIDTRDEL